MSNKKDIRFFIYIYPVMKNIFTLFLFLFSLNSFSQDTITTAKAKNYINSIACVTGKVVSYKLASGGKTTNYINLDAAYPNNVFTIVVTNEYLETSKIKIETLKDKMIFAYGRITTYKNDPKQIPQIFNPRWIEVKK
ncbi:hypothetical protein SAMN05660845_1713 [Flavobacterium swingsii]|jgi:hypothetical protein|uniref:tRNA_anti-like n=1 Tax=Flavobacterium swingsii TaxID=498292 RepID=A0A1I0YG91_9FLAO|nr:hypothetical protein [Flavobacterium swingsii]SFB11796.1 hypothetical protein SAMN05660845_1713 [Flavobacterium swingsii]